MIRMGVVADDITGSNDIGIMFAKAGYRTRVYNFEAIGDFASKYEASDRPEIVILNTNSRLDDPSIAYKKVYDASCELQELGCQQFHNKTCSVFRGNIGVEFDAMLDALNQDFAVVVLGFPKNGRTTVDGLHYVRGIPLHESEFRNDPVHPMTESNLLDILKSQSTRTVGLVSHKIVNQGVAAIQQAVSEARKTVNYVILDVTDQHALATIANAVGNEKIICGSSAIAEELPAVWQDDLSMPDNVRLPYDDNKGILIVAGSLMPQTRAQIDHMREQGTTIITLNTEILFDSDLDSIVEQYSQQIIDLMKQGHDVVFHSANTDKAVKSTLKKAQSAGFTHQQASRTVSGALARIVEQILQITGQNRLIVAGGETSDAVCKQLNINSLEIHREIQAGLPSCYSLTDPKRLLVLKSGSFGNPQFFEQALEHLRTN